MTIAPDVLAVLDQLTDPMQPAISDARYTIERLIARIDGLTKAEDKHGDCADTLADLGYEAAVALDHLIDLIEEKRR